MNNEVLANSGLNPVDGPSGVFRRPCYIRAMQRGLYVDAWLLPSCPAL